MFHITFALIPYFDWLLGPQNGQIFEKKKTNKRTIGPVNAHLRTGIYKIGQGHPKVMIYINFVEFLSLMLHAKFQNHRPSGSGEEDFKGVFAIYSHGGHLGHVTLTIYTNFHSPFLRILNKTFGFDRPNGFREKDL